MPRQLDPIFPDDAPRLWPEAGDTAFEPGDPTQPGVGALRWLGGVLPEWQSYAEGYRSAAERLGAVIVSDSAARKLWQPEIDRIALPLVAFWRQYLELMLKSLIPEFRDLPYGPEALTPECHNLKQLWDMAEPALAAMAGRDGSVDAVEAVVMEFHELDPTGQVFRYPVSTKGVWSLSELPETLDLGHLHQTMLGVAEFFYGSWAEVDAVHEARDEGRAYMAEESGWAYAAESERF